MEDTNDTPPSEQKKYRAHWKVMGRHAGSFMSAPVLFLEVGRIVASLLKDREVFEVRYEER